MSRPQFHIGVDTGGTFTDFVIIEVGGEAEARSLRISVRKLPSTPDDPGRVVAEQVAELRAAGADDVRVVHGSTVSTNALLENRVARTVFVTTRGFGDVIEIGRQDRPDIYALDVRPRESLVPTDLRVEVDERVGPGGQVVHALTDVEVRRVRDLVAKAEPESIAIGLLFAPENDAHERRLAEALRSIGVPVVASSEVLPEIREFERFATTIVSAAVAPIMEGYLRRLGDSIAPAPLSIMESGGGVMSADRVRGQAVRTVLSGPAGGVVAARALAVANDRDVVSFDMGGTSTDVSLVTAGQLPRTRRTELKNLPIAIPMVDVHTVGAGGGSLAWIDAGGALRAGPRSAGAIPGPICYGRGGATPTVTDANVLLGRLPRDAKLGGTMPLDVDELEAAFVRFGEPLGLGAMATALGVVRVIEAEMARALRRVTQERGVDPRTLALVPFGGAGGLHAVELARDLGMPTVIVPPEPGILSACGMLLAPRVETAAATVLAELDAARLSELGRRAEELERSARSRLPVDHRDGAIAHRELSLRFVGQSHELDVQWKSDAVRSEFLAAYRQRYGFADDARPIEVTALRCRVEVPAPFDASVFAAAFDEDRGLRDEVDVWLDAEHRRSVPRIGRGQLAIDEPVPGPAIVVERSSTLWLPEGSRLHVRGDRTLEIDVTPEKKRMDRS